MDVLQKSEGQKENTEAKRSPLGEAARGIAGNPIRRNLLFEATKQQTDPTKTDPQKPFVAESAVAVVRLRNATPVDGDLEKHVQAALLRIKNGTAAGVRAVSAELQERYRQEAEALINQMKGLGMLMGPATGPFAKENILRRLKTITENQSGDPPQELAKAGGTVESLIAAAGGQELTPDEAKQILDLETAYKQKAQISEGPKPGGERRKKVEALATRAADIQTIKDTLAPEDLSGGPTGDGSATEYVISAFQEASTRVGADPSRDAEAARNDLLQIATTGKLHGRRIDRSIPSRGHWRDTFDRRAQMLEIYARNPRLAEAIAENGVVGAHGTTSGSLIPVLEHGLLTLQELRRRGLAITAGERKFSTGGATSFIEYQNGRRIRNYLGDNQPITVGKLTSEIEALKADVEKLEKADLIGQGIILKENEEKTIAEKEALRALLENPGETDPELLALITENFPVIYLANLEGVDGKRVLSPDSSISSEFMVKDGLPKDNVGIVLVPGSKVSYVTDLATRKDSNVRVFPIEDYVPQFAT